MKKLILQNTLTNQILIYGGLALIMWPVPLHLLGMISSGSTSNTAFLYTGLSVMLVGVALKVYQQQQAGVPAFRNYLFRVSIGIAIAAIMMLTGLIKTPAFLQNLY